MLKEKALFGPAHSFFQSRLKVGLHDPCAKFFHELISKRCFYDQGVKWVLVVVIAAEMRAALIRPVRPYALLCYTQPGLEALRGHKHWFLNCLFKKLQIMFNKLYTSHNSFSWSKIAPFHRIQFFSIALFDMLKINNVGLLFWFSKWFGLFLM